jgi:hypothetical protein
MTKPLRELLKVDNAWIWDTAQENAFQQIKHELASSGSASFLICAYRISVSDIDLDVYATGLRLSPRFCLITAPMPNDDASAETMLGM